MSDEHLNSTERAPQADDSARGEAPRGPDALAELLGKLAEALDYLSYLLAAQFAQVRRRVKRLLILAALAALGTLVGLVVVVSSVWLAMAGLAGAIGQLCGGRLWLGDLLVGGTILLGGAVAIWIGLWKLRRSALASAKQRFAARQARQAERFGRSVHEAAEA